MKFNEDVEDVESVCVFFIKVNNICGVVDVCFVLFIIINGDMFGYCYFFGVFIKGFERFFSFVVVLNKI